MFSNDTRIKIKKSIAGISIEGANDHCTTVRNIIPASYPTSTTVKTGIEGKACYKEERFNWLSYTISNRHVGGGDSYGAFS